MPLFDARVHCRHGGKKPLSVSLEEVYRRRADGDDQVKPSLDKESVQIIDKRALLVLGETRGCERRLRNVEGLLRLLPQLFADDSCVFAPGRKIATEGMQKHDPLWLGGRLAGHREE